VSDLSLVKTRRMDRISRSRCHKHGRLRTICLVGQFLVRLVCECGTCREIEPEALARLVGWSVTLNELALRMRCSKCGKKAAEVVAVAKPRPRGIPKNPSWRRKPSASRRSGCPSK
jgi:hypothetical protein